MRQAELHPTPVELGFFALGRLEDLGSAVADHVRDCADCQNIVAGVPGDGFVSLLRTAQSVPETFRGGTDAQSTMATSAVDGQHATSVWGPTQPMTSGCPAALAEHPRYQPVRLLGQGGMGSVWLAEHRVMGRQVAVKVIRPEFVAQPGAAERFQREVQAAARLTHPNIVTAFDAEQAGDTHLLAMEYVEGVSLADELHARGPLPVAEACDVVRQAAVGLQHAFSCGLIHRDLKPHNLMRSADGTVKILDFGLAVLADTAQRDGGLTGQNVVLGTPDYIAPEQAEDSHAADVRSDIYSLGCTLYHLLTGKVPFPETSVLRKLDAHRTRAPEALRKVRPEMPDALAAVVAKMMAKKPDERYQTPAEVVVALEAVRRGTRHRPRRRWLAFAVALLCAGSIIAAGVIYRIQTDKGDVVISVESPDVEIVLLKGGKEIEVIDTRTNKRVRVPTGTYDVVVKNKPEGLEVKAEGPIVVSRGKEVLVRIEAVPKPEPIRPKEKIATFEVKHRVPTEHVIEWVAVAPDGKYFGSNTPRGITVWDGSSGQPLNRRTPGWFLWTADGKYLVTTGGVGLSVFDPTGRDRLRTIPLPSWIHGISCPPRGSHVLAWDTNKIHLCDAASDKPLRSWPMNIDIYHAWSHDGQVLFLKPGGATSHLAWDVQANKALSGYEALTKYNRILCLFPGGEQAWVSEGGHEFVVNVADGKRVQPLPAIPGPVAVGRGVFDWRVQLHGYADGWLRSFDMLTAKELASFRLPDGERTLRDHTIRLSPDGRYACVGTDRSVYLLRLPRLTPQ